MAGPIPSTWSRCRDRLADLPVEGRGAVSGAPRLLEPPPVVSPRGVSAETCAGCFCCDHEQAGAAPAPAAGDVRHLLYHVYPARDGGEVWRWNAEQLRRRMSLFNGLRLVGVATDATTDPFSAVEKALAGCGIDWIVVPNDHNMREMATFPLLLERASGHAGAGDAFFYGHAKGVTSRAWGPGVGRWTEEMYATCLDYWPAVRRLLVDYPTVGTFKRRYRYPGSRAPWHYHGAFRWHRSADLFSREWRTIDRSWIGSESHPGLHFADEEAAALVCTFGSPGIGLYGLEAWKEWGDDAVERFRERHRADRRTPLLVTCIITSHRKPRTVHQSIESVREQSCPDWQLLVVDSGDLIAGGELDRYRGEPRVQIVATGETPDMRGKVCLQGRAINECWRRGLVRGDLVCHLSDDDVYAPHAFETWLSAARQHPDQRAWYGAADRTELRPSGEVKVGELPTVGPAGVGGVSLDEKIDGMQVCCRSEVRTDWPEDAAVWAHADGVWMHALGQRCTIHPLPVNVGRHRHTPESTFTRPRGGR